MGGFNIFLYCLYVESIYPMLGFAIDPGLFVEALNDLARRLPPRSLRPGCAPPV